MVLLRLLNLRTAFSRVIKQEKVCDVRNIGNMLTRKFQIMAAVCTKRKRVLSICRQKYILPFSSGIFIVLCRISNFISDRCEFNSVRNGYAALRSFIPGSGWDFIQELGEVNDPPRGQSGTPKFKVGRLYLRSITFQQ